MQPPSPPLPPPSSSSDTDLLPQQAPPPTTPPTQPRASTSTAPTDVESLEQRVERNRRLAMERLEARRRSIGAGSWNQSSPGKIDFLAINLLSLGHVISDYEMLIDPATFPCRATFTFEKRTAGSSRLGFKAASSTVASHLNGRRTPSAR